LVIEQGRSKAYIVKELGISADTLLSCLKTARAQSAKADHRSSDAKHMRALNAEVHTLPKQLSEKDEIVVVLKNLSAYFLKSHR